MPDGGEHYIQQVLHGKTKGRGVDAGMASDIVVLKQRFINQQRHPSIVVVHQSHYADGTRRDIQKFRQVALICKGQFRQSLLSGQSLGVELFMAGEQKQVKGAFLPVTKK